MTGCSPEELVFENIIRIDEDALSKNFRVMAQCMNSFKLLTDRTGGDISGCTQLEKTNKTILEELDKVRKKQDKDFI